MQNVISFTPQQRFPVSDILLK